MVIVKVASPIHSNIPYKCEKNRCFKDDCDKELRTSFLLKYFATNILQGPK